MTPKERSGGQSGSADARFEGEYQSMRSALCASAPSHPLHAMPPRITRNSDRPRASDRTMVNIVLLAASCTLQLCHQQQSNRMGMGQHAKPLQGSRNRVGWISRKNLRSRRTFFLTFFLRELPQPPTEVSASLENACARLRHARKFPARTVASDRVSKER